jgi:hypothetical protein
VKFVNGDPVPKFERGGGTFSDETSADKTANTNAYRASSSAARVMKCIEQRKKKKWADPEFETEFETQ